LEIKRLESQEIPYHEPLQVFSSKSDTLQAIHISET